MDVSKISAIQPVGDIRSVEPLKTIDKVDDAEKQKIAKDFESVFLNKLVNQMSNTVVDWDGDSDPASGQFRGMFDMFLSQQMAEDGGIGMWKDIYRFAKDINTQDSQEGLDTKI